MIFYFPLKPVNKALGRNRLFTRSCCGRLCGENCNQVFLLAINRRKKSNRFLSGLVILQERL